MSLYEASPYLYLMFAGAGPWSIDAMLARRRAA